MQRLSLFTVLAQGTIVAWDEESATIILWNNNLILRAFHLWGDSKLEEFEAMTMNDEGQAHEGWDVKFERAQEQAKDWLNQLLTQD
jgi:hypothetical protein